jgi:hypothetical protein
VDRAREPRVARLDLGEALGGDQAERRLEAGQVGERRRSAELAIREVAAPPLPVPVEARRRVGARERERAFVGGDERQAGVNHQPLLRRADGDVDGERVHRERRRGERGDDIDDEERRMVRGVDRGADRRDVARRAARGVGLDDEDRADPMRGVVAQRRLDGGRVDREALAVRRPHRDAAERLDLLGPAVREVAGARYEHRGTGRDQVGDHRFPAAVAVGGVEEDFGAIGLQQRLHPRLAGGDQQRQARVAEVDRLARHRVDDLVRDAGRAGRMEQAHSGDSRHGFHREDVRACSQPADERSRRVGGGR